MVRSLFVAALVASLAVCGIFEYRARQKYDATEQQIAARRAELKKLAVIDQQVRTFEKQKRELEQRRQVTDRIRRSTH